ncbi:Anaphase spindle elongation protein [Nakaseomyces bracarensis]|uniref:Anaphase spindle elongation protein n=1 Tax=Nakaseomyces bracarensis TaxID=273131 RepID=A0ABR4NXG0_9SACH
MSTLPVSSPTGRFDRQRDFNVDLGSPGTPRLNSSGSTLCNSGEYMKLTPVKILEFDSPLKRGLIRSTSELQPSKLSSVDGMYKENFNVITKQLEKLLEDLNVIYRNIGYSNTEILNKEKLIFNTLSESIRSFFEQAENEMNKLTVNIEIEQEILNRILEIIGDPNGTKTIPDLYIRNAILNQKRKTVPQSPKKPLSLLSKKSLLESAREYIYNIYLPELKKFLRLCLGLQKLTTSLGMDLQDITEEERIILNNLNESDNLEQIFEYLTNDSPKSKMTLISEVIKKNKNELLNNPCLKDLSPGKFELISKLVDTLKIEYMSRIDTVCNEGQQLSSLLSDLRLDNKKIIPKKIRQIIDHYNSSNLLVNSLEETFFEISKSSIVELHLLRERFTNIHKEKSSIKQTTLLKCKQLWNRLNVPQEEIHEFMENNNDLSEDSIQRIQEELQRLEEMKKKLIKSLIENSYKKVEYYWNILQYTREEREAFNNKIDYLKAHSQSLKDDENVLEICEAEIEELEEKYNLYKPILELYEEFKSLIKDQEFLESSSKDSSRLLARNSHKILLKEEKTRKRITRHFPRVLRLLVEKLQEIETKFHKPFIVEGKNLLDIVSEHEKELQAKYPRSRISSVSRGRVTKNNSPQTNKNLKPVTDKIANTTFSSGRTIIRTNKNTQRTPLGRSTSDLVKSAAHRNNSSLNNKGLSSPKQLLPPVSIGTKIGNNARFARSILVRGNSSPIESNSFQRAELKPRQLFPTSLNKLNTGTSKIPSFRDRSKLTDIQANKENFHMFSKESEEPVNFSYKIGSPYNEPSRSIYKLSMSPEGKPKLDVEQRLFDYGLEDTSLMED